MPRTFTIRFEEDVAAQIEVLARLTRRTATEVVRTAIERFITEQRADPDFQEAVRRLTKQDLARMSRLSGR